MEIQDGGEAFKSGAIVIHGFKVDHGSFGLAPAVRSRRMDVIGDSILAGWGLDFKGKGGMKKYFDKCDYGQDQSGTFAAILCEHFGVNCTYLVASDRGMIADCCGNEPSMNALVDRPLPSLNESYTEGDESAPDAVLVMLGSNDAYRLHHPIEVGLRDVDGEDDKDIDAKITLPKKVKNEFKDLFAQTYINVLHKYAKKHPNRTVQFFLMARTSPGSHWDEWIEDVGRKANGEGLAAHVLTYKGRSEKGGIEELCHDHPSHIGHRQIFDLIREPFAHAMNWSSVAKPTQICNMNKTKSEYDGPG